MDDHDEYGNKDDVQMISTDAGHFVPSSKSEKSYSDDEDEEDDENI